MVQPNSAPPTNPQLSHGIYSPTEAKLYDEILDSAFIDIKYRPETGVPSTRDTWIKMALHDTFSGIIMRHLHPRTMIQLNFQGI